MNLTKEFLTTWTAQLAAAEEAARAASSAGVSVRRRNTS